MMKDDTDHKSELLQEPKLLMAISYDLAIADAAGMTKLKLYIRLKLKVTK
jgi:hypothetical protein